MLLAVCAMLSAITCQAAGGWFDDFSDVTGASLTQMNYYGSKTNVTTGTLVNGYELSSPSDTSGTLRLVSRDNLSSGADGRPGMWSVEVQNTPTSGWWAASYFGDSVSQGLDVPEWPDMLTMQDLADTVVEFNYRAINSVHSYDAGLPFYCRLEPLNNPFNDRAGFGRIEATPYWQSFSFSIGDADNVYNFLDAVNSGERLKLTVANAGEYQIGDALQIDDLRIHVVPEPASMALLAIGLLCFASLRRRR